MDLLGDIVEHDTGNVGSFEPPRAPNPAQHHTQKGFPRPNKTRPSRWRQRLEQKGLSSTSDAFRAQSVRSRPPPANEKESISRQNIEFLAHMSLADREEAKEELVNGVSDKTLEILQRRSVRKYGAPNPDDSPEDLLDSTANDKVTSDNTAQNMMASGPIRDVVPTMEGDNVWIGGYRDAESARKANEMRKGADATSVDDVQSMPAHPTPTYPTPTQPTPELSTPPTPSTSSTSSTKKVRFNNEATVRYIDEKKDTPKSSSDSDSDWEDIEYLSEDTAPSYEEAVKVSKQNVHASIQHAHFPKRKGPAARLDLADPDFNEKLHEKYFPDLPTNVSQLAWMSSKNVPATPVEVGYDSLDDLRFDFLGEIITSENIAQYSQTTKDGLHNHAAHPELPGYTLPELAQYLRSTYAGQRCIAARTLGRVMYKLGTLHYSVTEVTNERVGGPESEQTKSAGEAGMFEKMCWELILRLGVLDILNQSAADTEKNVSVRNYAIEALWLWNKAGGEEICKKVAEEHEKEKEVYQVY